MLRFDGYHDLPSEFVLLYRLRWFYKCQGLSLQSFFSWTSVHERKVLPEILPLGDSASYAHLAYRISNNSYLRYFLETRKCLLPTWRSFSLFLRNLIVSWHCALLTPGSLSFPFLYLNLPFWIILIFNQCTPCIWEAHLAYRFRRNNWNSSSFVTSGVLVCTNPKPWIHETPKPEVGLNGPLEMNNYDDVGATDGLDSISISRIGDMKTKEEPCPPRSQSPISQNEPTV
jgi:hypothetical protein